MLPLILIAAAVTGAHQKPAGHRTADLIQAIAQSGRCADIAVKSDDRAVAKPEIAPGPPPLLSFRYYEGKLHHRYGNAELMLDDAGH